MLRLAPQTFSRFLAYAGAFVLIALSVWLRRNFGDDISLDQVMWHLRYAERAALAMSTVFLVQAFVEVILVPCVLAFVASLVQSVLIAHIPPWARRALRIAPGLGCIAAIAVVAVQFSVLSHAAAYLGPDRFAQSYVEPKEVKLLAQGARKNLVVIYVESLEATYGDERLFGHDLLAPLREFGGRSYPDYRPIKGMNWTMAGIVATQCGVPLKVYAEADVRRRRGAKSFLPGATCLGDVLQTHGYRNVFMGGAPLAFAGKGQFLRDHGYTEIWGRDEWLRAGSRPGEMHAWGLHDTALFGRARTRLQELHASGKPFNLTLLTVDTHHPRGFMTLPCRDRGAGDFEGILHCSVDQLAGFLRFARDAGLLKDTTVVVVGDHLAVANPLLDTLEAAGDRRRIFNMFIGDSLPRANRGDVVPFDMFPTLLELAGMQVTGGRLALGYSAVGEPDAVRPKSWIENWSVASVQGSASYEALWSADVPVVSQVDD